MSGKFGWNTAIKMLFGAKSIYSNKPLQQMIEREVDPTKVKIPLLIGVVSLRSGEYLDITPIHSGFKQLVLASTTIPIVWKPVQVSQDLRNMVDGGVRNVCPLGSVIDQDPDEIVLIHCSRAGDTPEVQQFRNALDIGQRTVDILSDEIFRGDLDEFLRINRLVLQAREKHVDLLKENGKPYVYFKNIQIEPSEPMGDTLDFSRQALDRRYQHGWDMASRAFSEPTPVVGPFKPREG
jgi:predicted acylesterase/phospholipase RssA